MAHLTHPEPLIVGRPPVQDALAGADVARLAVAAPRATPDALVGDVRRAIVGQRHGSVSHVALVADGRFVGLVRDVDLMAAPDEMQMQQLAIADPPLVATSMSRDEVVWAVLSRGESEAVVVQDDGAYVGVVPASSLLAVLAREHADDIARISGYLHQGDSARAATEERVLRRLWHRLPWLVLGLVGAAAAAEVMGQYEAVLERDVVLAYFVPGLIYLAGAVGAQTVTVLVRGLSLGIPIRSIVVRELTTGLVIGLSLGVVFYPAALTLWSSSELALAVSLSIAAACTVSNIIAIGVPWGLHALGKDPAFGSGPLATVGQDIISLFIYFSIVSALVS